MINSQRSDAEKNKLIEEGIKKLVVMKLLIAIKFIDNSLKT